MTADGPESATPEPAHVLPLCLAQNLDADELLSRDPFALLVGMLLDQQFPMERAFAGPWMLAQRLTVDRLDPHALATMDPDVLARLATGPPAIHRYPRAMAARVQELAGHIVAHYGGDAAALWSTAADGTVLLSRLKALPGFGAQKAAIFLALLGKQRGITTPGWVEAAGVYAEPGSTRSIADVRDGESLARVRAFKQDAKRAARANKDAANGG